MKLTPKALFIVLDHQYFIDRHRASLRNGQFRRIAAFDLQPLRDDRGFFPPYQAAPVIRTEVLQAHPELREVFELLAGRLDDATMRRLNFEVDVKKRRPGDVAHEFLESRGLLEREK